jgi:hypothetical protein
MMDREDRDQLWRMLFGRSAITVEQARALLEQLQAEALADEAEQAAHGVRHLTAEHGAVESGDDERRAAPAVAVGPRQPRAGPDHQPGQQRHHHHHHLAHRRPGC